MDNLNRRLLKLTYGLNYKECSKAEKLMNSKNISLDEAAIKVLSNRTKQG